MGNRVNEYFVKFNVIFDGHVNVMAKTKKDAYDQVRSAIEPALEKTFDGNDTLFIAEKFDIEPKIVRDCEEATE